MPSIASLNTCSRLNDVADTFFQLTSTECLTPCSRLMLIVHSLFQVTSIACHLPCSRLMLVAEIFFQLTSFLCLPSCSKVLLVADFLFQLTLFISLLPRSRNEGDLVPVGIQLAAIVDPTVSKEVDTKLYTPGLWNREQSGATKLVFSSLDSRHRQLVSHWLQTC
eukprot:jgi/Botrbrau1/16768/Bobra.150_2s0003.2